MFLSKYRPKIILAILDLSALIFSGFLGLWLRFGRIPEPTYIMTWVRYLTIGMPLYFVIYFYIGLYSRIWRYASVREIITIATAVTVATVSLFGVMYVNPDVRFPRSVLVMVWFFNVVAVGGFRFAMRLAADLRRRGRNAALHKRTLVLGAGAAGRMLAEEIVYHPELDCRLVGFLDDDPLKSGFMVAGLPVLGELFRLEEIVHDHEIVEIIIAMPSAPYTKIRELVQRSIALGIKPKTMPGLFRMLGDDIQISEIRDVQIEDLLPRPEIKTDFTGIADYVSGRTVLITGAGGSIGSELSRQVANFRPSNLILLGHGENSIYEIHREIVRSFPDLTIIPVIADIQDQLRIDQVFHQYKPNVVFHAAAHKHVPLMEYNPTEALKNNVLGTKNVAEAADKHGVERFVMISSDKAVNPTNVMGATKRIAELVLQSINRRSQTKFMAVRFGNVLGSRGSVVPLFKEQIARGGPVTVTHPDIIRYFMTIPEAVSLVIQAGALGNGGEVFVLDMGEPVKIVDLARDLITLSGLRPDEDIRIEYTGLRPGEKLFEELLTAEEGTVATQHKRIFVARQVVPPASVVEAALGTVREFSVSGCACAQVIELAAQMSEVPENVGAGFPGADPQGRVPGEEIRRVTSTAQAHSSPSISVAGVSR